MQNCCSEAPDSSRGSCSSGWGFPVPQRAERDRKSIVAASLASCSQVGWVPMLQLGVLRGNPVPLGLEVVKWGLASLKGVLELGISLGKAPALEQDPQLCFLLSNPP